MVVSLFLDAKLRYAMEIRAEISECMQGGLCKDERNWKIGGKGEGRRDTPMLEFFSSLSPWWRGILSRALPSCGRPGIYFLSSCICTSPLQF